MSLAATLHSAAQERRPLTAPVTDDDPTLDEKRAYAIQDEVVQRRLDGGEALIGAKLGLTSRAKQERMGVVRPIYGWLTSGMRLPAGVPLAPDRFIHPRAEPEIAFLLGEELRPPATPTAVLAATRAVLAAVEVIDSRFEGFRFRLPDVVADNASAAGVVLGPVARDPADLGDLSLLGCVLRSGGEVVATAAGAAVLGHPAEAVAWLVDRLGQRGRTLPAGSLVLAGALTDAVPLERGDTVVAELEGLGSIELATEPEP